MCVDHTEVGASAASNVYPSSLTPSYLWAFGGLYLASPSCPHQSPSTVMCFRLRKPGLHHGFPVHFDTWADCSDSCSFLGFRRARGSGGLELVHSSVQGLNVYLQNFCEPGDITLAILKLAKMGIFTPCELATVVNQGLFFPG